MINDARLFAVAYSGYIALQVLVSWRWQLAYFRLSRSIERVPRLLSWWPLPRVTERTFQLAGVLLIAGCGLGAAGWRAGFALAALASLAYFGQILLLDTVQRKVSLLPQLLVVFAVAPGSVSPWAAPGDPWLLATAKMLIVLVYVAAGVTKIRAAGLTWADGRSLQAYLISADLRYDVPRARRLAAHRSVCAVLSASVIAFELFGWLWLFVPWGQYVFASLGLLLHVGVYAFMRVNFLKYFGAIYIVFAAPLLASVLAQLWWRP